MKTKLKKILNERGLKQMWVAKKLGVTQATISNWVRGKGYPTPAHLIALCELLNINLEDIVYRK